MQQLAENLWLLQFPLRLLGMQIGRNVSVIRLASGDVVVHSTAPFTADDKRRIAEIGPVKWIVDATRFHDSFADEGRTAFPEAAYLAPDGFPGSSKFNIRSLSNAPDEWRDELRVERLDGMPKVQEHVFLHVPSRTLIVGDFLFNFSQTASAWTKFVARHVLRLEKLVGMSPFFRLMIRDRVAFRTSVDKIMAWDFDRVVVGHGEVVESDGKARIREVLVKFALAARQD
jgi:hypothetical protein